MSDFVQVQVPTGQGNNVGCVDFEMNPSGSYHTWTVHQGYNVVDANGTVYWGPAWIAGDSGGRMPYYDNSQYSTYDCG